MICLVAIEKTTEHLTLTFTLVVLNKHLSPLIPAYQPNKYRGDGSSAGGGHVLRWSMSHKVINLNLTDIGLLNSFFLSSCHGYNVPFPTLPRGE